MRITQTCGLAIKLGTGLRLLQSVTCPFRSWHSLSGYNTYFMAFIGISEFIQARTRFGRPLWHWVAYESLFKREKRFEIWRPQVASQLCSRDSLSGYNTYFMAFIGISEFIQARTRFGRPLWHWVAYESLFKREKRFEIWRPQVASQLCSRDSLSGYNTYLWSKEGDYYSSADLQSDDNGNQTLRLCE